MARAFVLIAVVLPSLLLRATPTGATRASPQGERWRTYRNIPAGYAVKYPPSWTARERSTAAGSVTTFAPTAGRPSITITAGPAVTGGDEEIATPNHYCLPVYVGALPGTRCLDTMSFTLSVTITARGKTYSVATSTRGRSGSVFDRLVRSFRLIGV